MHPNLSIERGSLNFIEQMLNAYLFSLTRSYHVNKSLSKAMRFTLSGELLELSTSEFLKAVSSFEFSKKPGSIRYTPSGELSTSESLNAISNYESVPSFNAKFFKKSRSMHSYLQFDIRMIEEAFRKLGFDSLTNHFLVAITAILEYLTAEILESSGDVTYVNNKNIISIDDIIKAVNSDSELQETFNKTIISQYESTKWDEYVSSFVFEPLRFQGSIGVLGTTKQISIEKQEKGKKMKYVNVEKETTFSESPYNGYDFLEIEIAELEGSREKFTNLY